MISRKEFNKLKKVVKGILEILHDHQTLYDVTLKKKVKSLYQEMEEMGE